MAHTPELRQNAARPYRVSQRGIRPTANQLGIAHGTQRTLEMIRGLKRFLAREVRARMRPVRQARQPASVAA